MKKRTGASEKAFSQAFSRAFLVLILAALTAAVSAGCGKTEDESSSDAGATFEIDFGTTGASAEELASGSFASSLPASEFTKEAAGTGETAASLSGGTAAEAAVGVMPGGSLPGESTASTTAGTDDPASAVTGSGAAEYSASAATGSAAAEFSTSAEAIALRDGVPERSGADTDLKESVLSQALYACTGWGQSTGSSLHAISAATLLLEWSNSVSAGSVDSALLADTVRSEVSRLSPVQAETLRNNWSFIYYDADTILDSFKDVESLAEDAGCLEDARKASENKNSRKNWKAVYDAIDEAIAVQ